MYIYIQCLNFLFGNNFKSNILYKGKERELLYEVPFHEGIWIEALEILNVGISYVIDYLQAPAASTSKEGWSGGWRNPTASPYVSGFPKGVQTRCPDFAN